MTRPPPVRRRWAGGIPASPDQCCRCPSSDVDGRPDAGGRYPNSFGTESAVLPAGEDILTQYTNSVTTMTKFYQPQGGNYVAGSPS